MVKQVYWVEIAVLIDSGIFDFFSSQIQTDTNEDSVEEGKVERKIRELFSHIINGVGLLYSGINDSSIEISITLRHFYILKDGAH
ncbi:hypothetical protein CHS0354_031621 [Potamilus streckersoni]|uniref:Uncharacterized protein n=1 Tax=Potamilus streckersoni TaxID=2493646 RepID=A0AAE0SGZ4_9BIVA|nr:hypothetical protein CHS0354_031621 [Potamilus streckersoni]